MLYESTNQQLAMSSEAHGYVKSVHIVTVIKMVLLCNNNSLKCSLAFHLNFIIQVQVTVLMCAMQVQVVNWMVRSEKQGSLYTSQAARSYLRFPATATLNSVYNEVTFNEKLAIMKENLCTKYFPFTFKYITLNKKLPYSKGKSLHIFFHYRQSWVYSLCWLVLSMG